MSIFGKGTMQTKAKEALEMSLISSAGFMIADNNKDMIKPLNTWYGMFQDAEGLARSQDLFDMFMSMLADRWIDKPFLKLQFKNAMAVFNLSLDMPMTLDNLGDYQKFVDSFMVGVNSVE